MRKKRMIQIPLRRAHFLQQGFCIRALIVATLYLKNGWSREAIAKYLGLGYTTVCKYLNWSLEETWLDEDLLLAQTIVEVYETPLYVTHW